MSRKHTNTEADNFFSREREKLIAYIRSRITLPEGMTEEDILQDVALNVFSRFDPEEPIRRIASYVYASLRNRIIDLMRKRKAYQAVPLEEDRLDDGNYVGEPDSESHEDPMSEGIEIMYEAMSALNDAQQSIVRETELNGRTFRELSEESGIPLNTLITRKRRAMATLTKEMARIIEEKDLPWHPGLLD
jgi:RNA polymerase sigma-70 factor (ECF subfamily)